MWAPYLRMIPVIISNGEKIEPKDEPTSDNCTTFDVDLGEDISGNPDHDAARAIWGSTWRMPTKDECQELMDKCDWEDSTFNGFAGKKVTGPNGNYIFLPYSGSRYGSKPNTYLGISGKMWTSIPLGTKNGRYVLFDSVSYKFTQSARYSTCTVRPVSN